MELMRLAMSFSLTKRTFRSHFSKQFRKDEEFAFHDGTDLSDGPFCYDSH